MMNRETRDALLSAYRTAVEGVEFAEDMYVNGGFEAINERFGAMENWLEQAVIYLLGSSVAEEARDYVLSDPEYSPFHPSHSEEVTDEG